MTSSQIIANRQTDPEGVWEAERKIERMIADDTGAHIEVTWRADVRRTISGPAEDVARAVGFLKRLHVLTDDPAADAQVEGKTGEVFVYLKEWG